MNYQISQLNHVALHVSDLERSVQFYETVIGLKPIPRPDFPFAGAWFRIGRAQELHLIAKDEKVEPPERPTCHFAFVAEPIANLPSRLDENGVAFRGPQKRPDGATQIFLNDPDGHVVELTGDLPG